MLAKVRVGRRDAGQATEDQSKRQSATTPKEETGQAVSNTNIPKGRLELVSLSVRRESLTCTHKLEKLWQKALKDN
jgi:hypothetical protein